MVTSREKITHSQLKEFKSFLPDDLTVKFGDEIENPFIEKALFVFDGETYETSRLTWFLDWQNGRWHVSLQSRTHDYRHNKFDQIGRLIAFNYQANSKTES